MVKRLISILVALAVIAVIVMSVMGSGSYCSMVKWPWSKGAEVSTPPPTLDVKRLESAADSVVVSGSASASHGQNLKIVVEEPIEQEI